MRKKAKKVKKYNKEESLEIDMSREQLATMLCTAAVSWKTGVSFAELMANSVNENLRPDDFWLEIADVSSNVMGMCEQVDKEDIVIKESENATIN